MPDTSKKRGRKISSKNGALKKDSDNITINDFANSPSGNRGGLKKASTSAANERSCEDAFNACEDIKKIEVGSKVKDAKPRRKSKMENLSLQDEGIDYPLDLWFLISEYIEPEAVGKFACICKSSYHVVKTAKFWFHIYKRYYKQDALVPARLRPECMTRTDGLRACVIRALHLTYFLSAKKVGSTLHLQKVEPHSLVGRRCCLMWHTKGETRWYFYFKLKEVKNGGFSMNRRKPDCTNGKTDCTAILANVATNTEDGCRILRVSCLKYGMVPLVMGLILQTVKVTLSPGFDHHRIQLSFGTSYVPKTPTQVVLLNSVVDLNVLDWWHPCYPHHDVISSIAIEETNESWDFVVSDYLTV